MSKTVLITGASRGIGRETANAFAQNGYRVIINYFKSEREALTLKEELLSSNCDCLALRADVSKVDEVKKMMEDISKFTNHIDVLVNNAGIASHKLLCDTSEKEWDHLFDVNVKGMFNCTKAVLPDMIRRKNGKIINISSILGIDGASCEVAYSATKAAIIGFTKALSKEVGPSNIMVNSIAPGFIDTDVNKNLNEAEIEDIRLSTPLERLGTPCDVANAALFLASEKANFITGQVLRVDGGLVI